LEREKQLLNREHIVASHETWVLNRDAVTDTRLLDREKSVAVREVCVQQDEETDETSLLLRKGTQRSTEASLQLWEEMMQVLKTHTKEFEVSIVTWSNRREENLNDVAASLEKWKETTTDRLGEWETSITDWVKVQEETVETRRIEWERVLKVTAVSL
jgi:hypothetical protein